MKYIDTERLQKEIKRLERAAHKSALGCADSETRKFHEGKALAYQFVGILVDFLQQEQESVAERFAKIVRGNLIGIDKEVQQKFEQLYFEVTGNKMYGGYND